jgi:signal transduction histidine kinase
MYAPDGSPHTLAVASRSCFKFSPEFPEQMSDLQTPSDTNELARLRTLVADYETKLTTAAALVAHVRHEINNPLAALLGQAQLMLREVLDDKARRRVETIEKLAIRIKETVGELRDVQTPVAAVNRAEE